MRKIVFIADFFANQVLGGGELNNKELINLLLNDGYEVETKNSNLVNSGYLNTNKESFFIISNFVNLDYKYREWLCDNADYLIYEHDHKYLASRNPATYKDFKAPEIEINNYSLYKNARKIICQSDFHKNIIQNNLNLDNVISAGGNLWSLEVLDRLREFAKKEKEKKCSIMKSNIPHKNTYKAIRYCKLNNKEYELIVDNDHINFLDKLSENDTLIFFPGTPETLSRIICEARMMGMSVITNGLVGATHEKWFNLKGESLIDFMLDKRKEILNKVRETLNEVGNKKQRRAISIISTFHDGSRHLKQFLEDITVQTIFDKCELIFIDAASVGDEQNIIEQYRKKYDNIFYHRLDKKVLPTPCLNLAIKKSNSKYITFGFIDDRRKKDCLELLLKEIEDSDVDLVYGDVLQTSVENETFDANSSNGVLFEHSAYEYSKENMVKCLPGPMPLWKKLIHDKCGFFDDETCNFADDWDMWLRAVANGSEFKKVNKIVGLYLSGGRSQQEENIEQKREEADIFYKYKNVFGDNFFNYEPYFKQFLEL